MAFLYATAAALGCQAREPNPSNGTTATATLPMSAESVHVEMGACPFKCCQYGRWRADSAVVLYARRDTTSEHIGDVAQGMVVHAVTGAESVTRMRPVRSKVPISLMNRHAGSANVIVRSSGTSSASESVAGSWDATPHSASTT